MIFVFNGPNLNMLGLREPEIYGSDTLGDIKDLCAQTAEEHGFDLDFRQSNHEGELVTWIQEAAQKAALKGIVINAAAYTHTSVAIHDALKLVKAPIIEVHISDPKSRESFRHLSYIEPLAASVIAGQGAQGYKMAIEQIAAMVEA